MQLVAGLDLGRASRRDRLAAADDHVHDRLARQAEVAHRAARRSRRRPVDAVGEHLAAERADRPALDAAAAGSAGSSVVRPSRRASGSKLAPWIRVEVTTTKKMMLKISLARRRARRSPGRWRARSGSPRAARPSRASAARAARSARPGWRRAPPADARRRSGPPRAAGPRRRRRRAGSGRPAGRAGRRARSARPSRGPGGRRRSCAGRAAAPVPSDQRGQVDGEEAGPVRDLGRARRRRPAVAIEATG